MKVSQGNLGMEVPRDTQQKLQEDKIEPRVSMNNDSDKYDKDTFDMTCLAKYSFVIGEQGVDMKKPGDQARIKNNMAKVDECPMMLDG